MKNKADSRKRTTFASIFKIGFSEKPINILWLILLSLLLSLLPSLEIYMMEILVDKINQLVPYSQIISVLIIYIALFYFAPQLFSNVKSVIKMSINYLLDISLRTKILCKIARIGIKNFESGELPNKASRALNSTKSGFLRQYETVFDMTASLFSLFSIILLYGITGGGIIAICVICTIIVELLRKNVTDDDYEFSKSIDEKRRYNNELKALIMDKSTAPELNFCVIREKLLSLYEDGKVELDELEYRHMLKTRRINIILRFIDQIKHLFCFIYLFVLFVSQIIDVSLMITFVYAVFRISSLTSSIMGLYRIYISNRNIFTDIDDILSFEEEAVDSKTAITSPPTIEFRNVSYRYPAQNEYALSDVSFTIKAGERAVFCGKNGSGKSTVLRLILGYDKPESGAVLINGIEAHLSSHALRAASTALFQDYAKYELTLRDNITASNFDKQADTDEFDKTINWADIAGIIEKAANQLDTDIIHGGNFSGGEWQKIAFARTKFKAGRFVALDEPNSAVDAKFEMEMYKKFLEVSFDSTSLVVSHRLPICQLCDRIIVLDKGRVVENGSHDELLQKGSGYYHSMYVTQANLYY